MKSIVEYITEAKSLEDKLKQIERINDAFNKIRRKIHEDPSYEKKWIKDGKFDFAEFGKQGMLSNVLMYNVCKEYNIAPYTVTYNGCAIFQDLDKDKPFCFYRGKKKYLKPETKVDYLGNPQDRSELGRWTYDKDVIGTLERYIKEYGPKWMKKNDDNNK